VFTSPTQWFQDGLGTPSLSLSLFLFSFSPVETNFMTILFFSIYSYLASVVGLLYLRYCEPNLKRPFRVWTVVPILFTFLGLFLFLMPFIRAPLESCLAMVLVLAGLPLWVIKELVSGNKGTRWQGKKRFAINHFLFFFFTALVAQSFFFGEGEEIGRSTILGRICPGKQKVHSRLILLPSFLLLRSQNQGDAFPGFCTCRRST